MTNTCDTPFPEPAVPMPDALPNNSEPRPRQSKKNTSKKRSAPAKASSQDKRAKQTTIDLRDDTGSHASTDSETAIDPEAAEKQKKKERSYGAFCYNTCSQLSRTDCLL